MGTLKRKIRAERLERDREGGMIAARRVLAMYYAIFTTDSHMLEVITINHLSDIQWEKYGDKNPEGFLHEFMETEGRTKLPIHDGHKLPVLERQLCKSEGFKWDMSKYDEIESEDYSYKYQRLLTAFQE